MNNKNDKHKSDSRIALGGTLLVHALLLLLLFSFRVQQPQYETPEIEEFDVMLGEDEQGDGQGANTTPMRPRPAAQPSGVVQHSDFMPSTPTASTSPTTRTQRPTHTSTPSSRAVTPRATPSTSSTESRSSSTSSSTGSGDRPKAVLGNRNSGRGVGRGTGTGQGESGRSGVQGSRDGSVIYALGKRRLVARPNSYGSFSTSGTVRVQIYVNRAGSITRHHVLSSSSSELSQLAVSKLSQVKFNQSDQAPPEQQGTLTFKFKLR